MGIFDRAKRQNPNGGNGTSGDSSGLDLEGLRKEVPDSERTVDEIERALREPMEQDRTTGGCGCWG